MKKYKNIVYSSLLVGVLTTTTFAEEIGHSIPALPIEIINLEPHISTGVEKLEEEIQEREQKEKEKQEQELRYNVVVSYYTHLPHCTTTGSGITASGNKVSNTSLAIPRNDSLLNFGDTVIFDTLAEGYMKDYNGKYLTRVADDTGNPNYIKKINDNTYKLDVYCPKLPNENNTQYLNRVRSYGITKTKITIKNNK